MAKLYINGNEIELSNSIGDFGITIAVADQKELNVREGSTTKTVRVPFTKPNKKAFGFAEDLNITSVINQNTDVTARYESSDGETLIEGKFKITKTIWNFLGEGAFEGVVIGDNGDWRVDLINKKLPELDFSGSNHTLSYANVTASWDTANAAYRYGLINFGRITNENNLELEEVFPLIRIKDIVTKCFNEIGYTVSSTFLDSSFFGNLYMLYVRGIGASATNSIFKVGLSGDIAQEGRTLWQPDEQEGYGAGSPRNIFNNESYDNGNNFDTTTYIYTASQAATLNFTFDLKYYYYIDPADLYGPAPTMDLVMKIQRSTDSGTTWTDVAISNFSANTYSTTYTYKLSTGDINVEIGDQFRCYLGIGQTLMATYQVPHGTIKQTGTYFSCTAKSSLLSGTSYNISNNLPDKTCIEFLQGLKHLFNLYFKTDINTRTVYIEPRDDFYYAKSLAINWSDKIDLSEPMEAEYLGENFKKRLKLNYLKDSNDLFVQEYEKQKELNLSSYEEELDNKYVEDSLETVTNNFFAPTIMDSWDEMGFITQLVPKLWNGLPTSEDPTPEFTTEFEPRIFYWNGKVNLPVGEAYNLNSNKQVVYPEFYSCDQTSSNDNSLWFNTTNYSHGLFEKYYRNEINHINNARVSTAMFYLTPKDISQLDIRKPIYLNINGNEHYFIINKIIDYNPDQRGSTKVELITYENSIALSTLTADATDFVLPSGDLVPLEELSSLYYTNDEGDLAPVYHTDTNGAIVSTYADLSMTTSGYSHD